MDDKALAVVSAKGAWAVSEARSAGERGGGSSEPLNALWKRSEVLRRFPLQ